MSFDVVYASENPVLRSGWDDKYYEILECKPENVMLERFTGGSVPLLDVHSKYSIEDQYGRVINPRFEDNKLMATVMFSRQEDKAGYWNDIKAGIISSFSAGYRIHIATKDESKSPYELRATKWEPMELSLAPVPADYMSQIRSDINAKFHDATLTILNSNKMSEQNRAAETTTATTTTETAPVVEQNRAATTTASVELTTQERTAIATGERKRVVEIKKVIENARSKGFELDETFENDLIENNRTVAEAKVAVLDKMADMTPTNISQRNAGNTAVIGEDETVKQREAMSDAIIHRAAPGSVTLNDKSKEFTGMKLIDMARVYVGREMGGIGKTFGISENELVHRAISTTDYADLLTSTMSRQLRKFYEAAPQNWKPLASQTSVSDFRAKTGVQIDGKIDFDLVPENGEYKRAKIGTNKATIQVDTYGKMIQISRKAIINDDLDAFGRLPRLFATGASNKQSSMVWDLLVSGKTPDGKTIFHADHANLAGSGGALSEATLNAAFVAIYKQLSPEKEVLALTPKFLVVPVELETAARKILSGITAHTTGDVNVFANSLQLIVEPRLSMGAGSATAWYIAADPAMVEGLMYAYLNGNSVLYTETRTNFEDDSIETKARFEFGVAAWDYRGLYKNAGA